MGGILRRIFKGILLTCILLCAGLALLVFWVLEDTPRVTGDTAPSSQEVVAARAFFHEAKAALDPANPTDFIYTDEAQLNGVIKLGARLIPGFRGQVQVQAKDLTGHLSLPVPYLRDKWINLSARLPSFEGQLALADVTLGPLSLPPALTLELLRIGANQTLGQNQGDRLVDVAQALRIEKTNLTFAINQETFGSATGTGLIRGLFGALRGGNPPAPEDVMRHYTTLRQAMDAGQLPSEGSYLPYLHFTLGIAQQEAAEGRDIAEAYTAALFALTLACGAQDFTLVVGGLNDALDQLEDNWQTSCNKLTLNGRIDSRLHFTTSAAIQAASNRGVAVSIGEFKELYDSSKSGGFDFTDIAANNSGIRMSNTFMQTPAENWPARLTRLSRESDIIIPYEGIPQIMSGDAFRQTYGDMDDARYQTVLAQIETRIDRLAVHQK